MRLGVRKVCGKDVDLYLSPGDGQSGDGRGFGAEDGISERAGNEFGGGEALQFFGRPAAFGTDGKSQRARVAMSAKNVGQHDVAFSFGEDELHRRFAQTAGPS